MARTPRSGGLFFLVRQSTCEIFRDHTPVQMGQFGRHRMRSRKEVRMGGQTRIDHLKQLCYVNPTSTKLIL
jgi:hypothetical protein